MLDEEITNCVCETVLALAEPAKTADMIMAAASAPRRRPRTLKVIPVLPPIVVQP
jgi:hypothetical protein